MLKGMKWVLVAVCMIAMLIFGGDYAFAEETPSVAEKPSLETVEKPNISDSSQSKPSPCLPGKPCVETRHFQLLPCLPLPGKPCIGTGTGGTSTLPPKAPPNPPASQAPDLPAELSVQ